MGSIGTVATLLWGVAVYRSGLKDSRRAQARLLTPVVDPLVLRAPGSVLTVQGQLTYNWPVGMVQTRAADGTITETVGRPIKTVRTRVVSTAQEGFTNVRLVVFDAAGQDLQLSDGNGKALPPGEVIDLTHIARPGTYKQPLRLRVTFRDAAGRHWERWSDRPLRPHRWWRRRRVRIVPPSVAEQEVVASVQQFAAEFPEGRPVDGPALDDHHEHRQRDTRGHISPPARRDDK